MDIDVEIAELEKDIGNFDKEMETLKSKEGGGSNGAILMSYCNTVKKNNRLFELKMQKSQGELIAMVEALKYEIKTTSGPARETARQRLAEARRCLKKATQELARCQRLAEKRGKKTK
jgi:hypothetical protein